MGIEHIAAVWNHSRQSGSNLVVLLAVASYSDHRGQWTADQATLQRRARLGRRRIQQILEELVAKGELAVTPGDGRGHPSTYRLLLENPASSSPSPGGRECGWERGPGGEGPSTPASEKGEAHCTLSPRKGEAECTLSAEKGEAHCALSQPKGEPHCTLSEPKGAAECALSTPLGPPFPPNPQIPLYPPKEADMESFALALRPLAGPQSATFRTNLILEEAGVPLPSPAQIGLWVQKLGGVEPLLDILRRLIQAGLANKRNPAAYIHRVVLEHAERPEPTKPLNAHGTRVLLRTAGSDETRRQQALRIIAKARGEVRGEQ